MNRLRGAAAWNKTWNNLAWLAMGLVLVGCSPPAGSGSTSGESAAADNAGAPEQSAPHETAALSETAPSETAASDSAEAPPEPTGAESAPAPAVDAEPAGEAAIQLAAADDSRLPAAAGSRVLLPDATLTGGIPGEGPLSVDEIQAWLANPANHETLDVELPVGLAEGAASIKGLAANPLTRAKIELGRQLYFDTRLSADNSVSCASCHHPDEGFARHTRFGVGIRGQEGGRNSPVSYNRILSDKQFWDGRAGSLEEQAVGPIQNPIEMGNTHEACVKTLSENEGYRLQFQKIFGGVTIEAVGQALASFERVVVSGPSPYDYERRVATFADVDLDDLKESDPEAFEVYEEFKAAADAHPISESARRGMQLYFSDKASCAVCHLGANLTDELYHNLGIGMDAETPDEGRSKITGDPKDYGAFKTPTVRNVALSAPYMHDGSLKTLEEVVEWYDKGGHPNKNLSQRIKKLNLSAQEKQDLVAFMNACTGEFPKVETGRLPK